MEENRWCYIKLSLAGLGEEDRFGYSKVVCFVVICRNEEMKTVLGNV